MQGSLQTVPYVDLARYAGRWFEVASTQPSFQTGCTDVEAHYQPLPDGTVRVVNRCLVWPTGGPPQRREVEGVAVPDDASNAVLSVSFDGRPAGKYLVLAVDPDYAWALVGSDNGEDFWVLARSVAIDPGVYGALLFRAAQLGYPVGRLEGGTFIEVGGPSWGS